MLGLIIGALFVQYTSWPWIFYFTAIMGSTIGITCFILIPKSTKPISKARFDVFGIATLSCKSIVLPCLCDVINSRSAQRPSSSSSSLLRLAQFRDGPPPTSSRHCSFLWSLLSPSSAGRLTLTRLTPQCMSQPRPLLYNDTDDSLV